MKKMADYDTTLLNNRIAMLENEQTRMLKKIENTRRKAEKIVEVKKNNDLRAQRLAEEKEKQEIDRKNKQIKILQERKQRKMMQDYYKKIKMDVLQANGHETYLER